MSQTDMARFFDFEGRNARIRMGKWEGGDEIPPLKHRDKFIDYLLKGVGLQGDPETFNQVWQILCEEWRWPALSASERQRHFATMTIETNNSKEAIRNTIIDNEDSKSIILTQFKPIDIEDYIKDEKEKMDLRLRALSDYIDAGYRSGDFFNELANDSAAEIRRAIIRYVYQISDVHPPISIKLSILEKRLDDHSDEVCTATIRAIQHLVEIGQLPLEYLTIAKKHRYWLVRRIAVGYIAQADAPNSLDLLYEYRTVSYHISQQIIEAV